MTNMSMDEIVSNISKESEAKPKKRVNKKFIIIFSVIFVLLCGSVFSVLFFGKYFIGNKASPETTSEDDPSIFSTILNDTEEATDSYEVTPNKLDPNFKKEVTPFILLDKKIYTDLGVSWSWESSWMFGDIVDITETNIKISVSIPDDLGTIEAKYICEQSKSVLVERESFRVLATNIDFYKNAKPRYLMYTHCLNENCSEVGNGCVVVKMF